MNKIKNYIELIRVKHYIKNLLIFVPLFFSGLYSDINNIIICLIGFILFSLTSSVIYIFNDICDIEKDRLHEIKKTRPLAAGKVTLKEAYIIMTFLIMLVAFIAYILGILGANMWALLLVAIYLILNILYTKWLKNVVLVDVVILVLGFLIRLYFGAALIFCTVSQWLYLTVMSGAFYMGFGKRRNEIIKGKNDTRKVLKYYNKDFLDKSMHVCLTLTVVFYSMWAVDPSTIAKLHYNYLIYTIPLIMFILFQYSLAIEKDSHGDPVNVLVNNKSLIITILLYLLIMIIIWV